jgi:hypothetical protein
MVYGKIIYAPRMEDINNYANRLWIRVTDEARLRLDASDSIMASGKSVFPLLLSFLETRNLALQCKVEVAELGRKVIVMEPAGEAYSDGVALRLTDEVAENAGPSNDEVRAQIWEYVMGKSRTKPPVLIADVNAAGNALIFKAGSTVKTKQPTELWLKVAPAGALGRVSVIRFIEPGHFISVTYGMTEGSCKRIDSKQGRGSKGSWEMSRHVKERL